MRQAVAIETLDAYIYHQDALIIAIQHGVVCKEIRMANRDCRDAFDSFCTQLRIGSDRMPLPDKICHVQDMVLRAACVKAITLVSLLFILV